MRRCFDGGGTGVIEGLGRRVAHHVECGRHGEHFDAFLRHNHGVFELRRAAAILGHSRPVVRPQTIFPRTSIDHRLDGEHVAFAHNAHAFVVRVVRNVGRAVEQRTNAVSTIRFHHTEFVFLGNARYRLANVPIHYAGFHHSYGSGEACTCTFNQFLGSSITFANVKRSVAIAMIAVFERGDVAIDNVAFNQRPIVRNAVTNHFIYRDTHRFRKAPIV
mmetsp:Transcript_2549/g.4171  ORF Transcript_2549/g.4171 Transcript_2549/m.4171 type:complete len:218 (-) Transcript_2549:538-1191(-)